MVNFYVQINYYNTVLAIVCVSNHRPCPFFLYETIVCLHLWKVSHKTFPNTRTRCRFLLTPL